MSNIDYTPVLLAQLTDLSMKFTDLSMRLTQVESVNSTLKAELERITGRNVVVKSMSSVKTSVPLIPMMHSGQVSAPINRPPREGISIAELAAQQQAHQSKPQSLSHHQKQILRRKQHDPNEPFPLSNILLPNEEVSIAVNTHKDDQGNIQHTTCVTTFDGTNLVVKRCDLVPSLINMSFSKPGEILYRFIDELTKAGHLKRAFSTAPWKLCFVERDGQRMNLEEVRRLPK